jgi:hypothetical protein
MKNKVTMKWILTFALFVLSAVGLQAQIVTMDHNNVRANMSNDGLIFKTQHNQSITYEIPKGSGQSPLYSTGIWMAGFDQDSIPRLACTNYGGEGNDFFPGPFSSTNSYTDSAYIAKYGLAIWDVSKSEIDYHLNNYYTLGYVAPASILNWPGNGESSLGTSSILAPFIDGNSNGVYEPNLGDVPLIRGDFAKYVIVNDAKADHTETGGEIIDVELHFMYYQFISNDYKNNTMFLNTKVFNRGAHLFTDFKVAMYMDCDIGNGMDDYTGCDSSRNLAFAYNGDLLDQSGGSQMGYGNHPPTFGMVALSNPMAGFVYFSNGGPAATSDPNRVEHYFNYFNGKWRDGSPVYYGGTGHYSGVETTTTPTSYALSGNPADSLAWTEYNSNHEQGDRRQLMILKKQLLEPGNYICNDFAFLFSRDGDYHQNIQGIYTLADQAKADFVKDFSNKCLLTTTEGAKVIDKEFSLYPNPSNGDLIIQLGDLKNIQIEVTTASGQVIHQSSSEGNAFYKIHLQTSAGIYFVKVSADGYKHAEKLIIH